MISLYIPAPRVNKLQKTGKEFKKLDNGKRAPAVERPAWLNANQRLNHHQKGKYVALWREKAAQVAKARELPRLGDSKVFCIATIRLPRNSVYDAANYHATVKPIIDGIVTDYGMLNDDDNEHLVGPLCVEGPKSTDGFGGVSLEFYELSDDDDQEALLEALKLA